MAYKHKEGTPVNVILFDRVIKNNVVVTVVPERVIEYNGFHVAIYEYPTVPPDPERNEKIKTLGYEEHPEGERYGVGWPHSGSWLGAELLSGTLVSRTADTYLHRDMDKCIEQCLENLAGQDVVKCVNDRTGWQQHNMHKYPLNPVPIPAGVNLTTTPMTSVERKAVADKKKLISEAGTAAGPGTFPGVTHSRYTHLKKRRG